MSQVLLALTAALIGGAWLAGVLLGRAPKRRIIRPRIADTPRLGPSPIRDL